MYYKDFESLIEQRVRTRPHKKRIAVVMPEGGHTLGAVAMALEQGLLEPILIGDRKKILSELGELSCGAVPEIVEVGDADLAVQAFLDLVRANKCDGVMKGQIDSKAIMKAIVNKENGLATGNIISAVALNKIPHYHKLVLITDPGVVPHPDFEKKKGLLQNAVDVMHKLGVERPKVAVLCYVDQVDPKIQETVDAQKLTELGDAGAFGNCEVYGPLSYDLAVSIEAAAIKKMKSAVAGDPDIMLVPDINSGNILTKALVYSAGGEGSGIIVGAKIPVIFSSRASSTMDKLRSIAFSCALD